MNNIDDPKAVCESLATALAVLALGLGHIDLPLMIASYTIVLDDMSERTAAMSISANDRDAILSAIEFARDHARRTLEQS